MIAAAIFIPIVVVLLLIFLGKSLKSIGPTQVGLVTKLIGRKLPEDDPIALHGEAGYQADMLMPGLRFKFWPIWKIEKFPWVQVPAGEIGVVVAQVGRPLPIGAKSARYKPEFGNFTNVRSFLQNEGEKGVQRPVLSPGTLMPIHPVAFLVITKDKVYGRPVSPQLVASARRGGLSCESFGLAPEQLEVVRIEPRASQGQMIDTVGIVTTFEGDPLPSGFIASRLGDFADVTELEARPETTDPQIIEALLGSKNQLHNNYQDFQAFLDNGGRIGLQHDPLLYGAYALNPFLVKVESVPMLVVMQGEVAVIKAYVGLATVDTSGAEFKFGSLVRPGHRGIWQEALRTGKYPINPHCYEAEIVPTSILTLNWASAVSEAHDLDRRLSQIEAKSREGFVFKIDLQVQIHVPDTKAPRVISVVGTMQNLVNEVLQAAVGNHFRDKLQSMGAIEFIEKRQQVQQEAQAHISNQIAGYEVETRGVYIQDVVMPEAMVEVLTNREIANQEIQTFKKQEEAQQQRIAMEQARGTADMQGDLAKSKVGIDISANDAQARKNQADGEATYTEKTGAAKGAEVRAVGLARAEGYKAQVDALGANPTAWVNIATALASSSNKFVPEVVVVGGGDGKGSGSVEGLVTMLLAQMARGGDRPQASPATTPAAAPTAGPAGTDDDATVAGLASMAPMAGPTPTAGPTPAAAAEAAAAPASATPAPTATVTETPPAPATAPAGDAPVPVRAPAAPPKERAVQTQKPVRGPQPKPPMR
jgi:regulator of protease activity HflC (stomatin/prohibitin superfamily)